MNLDLIDKRAVVCGSTQGIGKAAAVELALLGANVTLIARDENKLQQVIKELHSTSAQQHEYIVADFNSVFDLKEKAEAFAAKNSVHILVNNTGGPAAGPAIAANLDEFAKAFSAHLLCNQVLVQAFVPSMKKSNYGRIINVISTSVKIPIKGLGVSNTIRGAVANWSKTLSLELAPFGITVNNVLPGATKTGRLESLIRNKADKAGVKEEDILQEMIAEIPAGRVGEVTEIASAIAFLASPAASYINGVNLAVDGGRTGSL